MKYYQEVTILPTPEIATNFIWSKIYQQLHIAFAEQMRGKDKGTIGVSFPEYKKIEKGETLGNKVRVFAATEKELANLHIRHVLIHYEDYVHITKIRQVPEKIKKYAIYRRYHEERTKENKARRFMSCHQISYEEAVHIFPETVEDVAYPYIRLESATNKSRFRLFIAKDDCSELVSKGFGSYGLDTQSSLPEF